MFFQRRSKNFGLFGKDKSFSECLRRKKTWKNDMSQLLWKTDWVPIGRTLFPKKPRSRPNTHFWWLSNNNNELSNKVTGTKICTKVVKEGFRKSFLWPILISCYAIISLHRPSRTCWWHDRSSCRRQCQKNEKAPLLRGSNTFSFFFLSAGNTKFVSLFYWNHRFSLHKVTTFFPFVAWTIIVKLLDLQGCFWNMVQLS